MRKFLFYSYLFFLIHLLLGLKSLLAGEEVKNTRLNATQLASPGEVVVYDDKYPACEIAGQSLVAKSQGRIILSVDANSKAYVADYTRTL